MRLVIDGERLDTRRTGVGRCLESLLEEWALTGWPLPETLLVLKGREALRRVREYEGLRRVVVGPSRPGVLWQTWGLRGVLREDDLLLSPANVSPPNWRGRTLLILHDTLTWSVPGAFSWGVRLRFNARYRMAARRAARVVVPSESTALEAQRVHGLSPDRITVAHPGAAPVFRPDGQAGVPSGLGPSPYFLFVGKRSRRRHVPEVLAAFAEHRRQRPDDRLVFAGPGPEGDLPGPGEGVDALGFVNEARLAALYRGALALLYPSDFEGFGLPVVEAMASGCPVVTLRNSALIESAGEAAYFLESARPEALARALAALSADETLRARLVAAGLAHAAGFSPARFAGAVRAEVLKVAAVAIAHS